MSAQDRLNKRMEKRARSKKVGIKIAVSEETKHRRMLELQADIYMQRSCGLRKRGK